MMLFLATTINYLDRQVLSLTWKDFIAPEFHWTDADYGFISGSFSLIYAICMLFAGRLIDFMGSKKGYLWAIGIWSGAALLHVFCGSATRMFLGIDSLETMLHATADLAIAITTVSTYFFIAARSLLALGEAGNFPAAIKITAEYFPKKDRAFATSVFNAGTSVGALISPVSIPVLAKYFKDAGVGNGWEMAFIIMGALGFAWMAVWVFIYKKPQDQPKRLLNSLELEYITQDVKDEASCSEKDSSDNFEKNEEKIISFWKCFTYRQTWAFAVGKFFTDPVWWFFLFWTPAYLKDVYGLASHTTTAVILMTILYLITILAIFGGYLPKLFINKLKMDPYAGSMRAMRIFAFFPLLALAAPFLGSEKFLGADASYWWPILIIGIACAAHQSWSANIFSTVGNMFPKSTVATITGIGGMAGGVGSAIIHVAAGFLFDKTEAMNTQILGFTGKESGYFIVFCYCAVAYILAWCIMKILVPKFKVVSI